jgi:tight adherence protein C
MSPLTLAVATFVSVALLAGGIAWLVRNWNAPALARLRALSAPEGAMATASAGVLAGDRPASLLERLLTRLGQRVERPAEGTPELVHQQPLRSSTAQLLAQAGFERPNAPAVLVGVRLALVAAFVLVGVLLAPVDPRILPVGFALAPVGFVLPRFLVVRMAAMRRAEVERSLPDVIDLLTLCVEAGLGLNSALVKVADERGHDARDPLGQELGKLAKELQMGIGRRDAFRSLADRTGAIELRALAAHLVHAERFGSSVAATLRTQAQNIRTHRRLMAEELANKTQVKLLFPLIMFIFPSVMIVILMPAVMRLMEALTVLM